MNFKEQLSKTINFFKDENLEKTNIAYTATDDDIRLSKDLALLLIDVQKEFCDPKKSRGNQQTEQVTTHIADVLPAFRKAGVKTYAIYFSQKAKRPSKIDFYKFTPEAGDTIIRKDSDSAFWGSNIDDVLKKDGKKTLLTAGFNLNACVYRTVMDARREGYDVCVITDMTGNDNLNIQSHASEFIEIMKSQGVRFATSDEVLKDIRTRKRALAPAA